MPSKLDVWNDALEILDQGALASTTPTNTSGRALNRVWQAAVESCLEVGDWDFAKLRGPLSRVLPAPAFGYRYYYELPGDCLRLVFISETGDPNSPLTRYAPEAGKIATDAETVYAIWISSTVVETPGLWSASFARFVAATMAERCLRLNPSAKDDVDRALKKSKPAAEGVDATQNPPAFRRPGRMASSIRGFSRSREQG